MDRIWTLLSRVRESVWAVPAGITIALGLLAPLTVWLDSRYAGSPSWLPGAIPAGAEGARGVLMTIAGSLMTVTGVVFSITIVALQLASSQYTPRVLRAFRTDRANHIVLGVFIGTFTYALIVLGTVRSAVADSDRFVPTIAVGVSLLLGLVSVGFLIFFIHHIVGSIQAETIIERVTREALEVVDHLFPEDVGAPPAAAREPPPPAPRSTDAADRVLAPRGGFLQEIREDSMLELAAEADVTLTMERCIGDFVLPGETLATVAPGGRLDPRGEAVRSAFLIGSERTNRQDVQRGVIELTDIAVRALSPGINDPTTALVCVDRLTQVLAALGCRRFPDLRRLGPDGRIRLVARRTSFDDIVRLAYRQLRHHGAADPTVAERLARSLRFLATVLPQSRATAVREELDELLRRVEDLPSARDRDSIRAAARP